MKSITKIYILFLTIYILLYKIFLIFFGDLIQYIINPLMWISLSVLGYMFIYRLNKKYYKYEKDIIYIVISSALIYILLFYSLGFLVGYANNPYSRGTSGIIINLFSILLIVGLKEYIRGILINEVINNKMIYQIIIGIVFVLSDLNLIMIINMITDINNLFIIFNQLLIPIISLNIFSNYLCTKGGYLPSLIFRLMIFAPFMLISVIPDYDPIIPTLFDLLIPLFTYVIIRYNINKRTKEIKEEIKPIRWILTFGVVILLLLFSLGIFPIKPIVVLTGSMKPNINEGDLLIIKKCHINNIKPGDIIEYKIDNYNVVHRVIKILKNKQGVELIVKGDSNLKEDKLPVTKSNLVGCFSYRIPYLGYPAYFVKQLFSNHNVRVETGD